MTQRSLVVVVLVLALCAAMAAQRGMGFGSIGGNVRTFDGNAVRDARVEIRDGMTGTLLASGYTTPSGTFDFPNVPDGTYELVVDTGMDQLRERVQVTHGPAMLSLRLPRPQGADAGSGHAVSVAQLKVPGKARNEFHKAERALQKRDHDGARQHLEKALGIYPEYAEALTLRAVLWLDAQEAQKALDDLERAAKADPQFAMAYVVQGAVHNRLSQFDDALRALDRGTALAPTTWQAYFEKGKALLGKREYEAAVRQLQKAQQYAPKEYAPIHLVKAHAFLGLRLYPDAMTELETYLQRDPEGAASVEARQTLDKVRAFTAAHK